MKLKFNVLNPLDWINSAQNWFSQTERSSGFRPYLIFLLIYFGFVLVLLFGFPNSESIKQFVIDSLYLVITAFIILYGLKAFQDPDFCRSEKHIENVKRLERVGQKNEVAPQTIDADSLVVVSKPDKFALTHKSEGYNEHVIPKPRKAILHRKNDGGRS
jgi:hypothetical protein